MDKKGRRLIKKASEKLIGRNIGIFLEDIFITAPKVDGIIDSDIISISLDNNIEKAKDLEDTINSGLNPFKLEITRLNGIELK